MNLPFYIAKRYLISKKSHNIINIISGISISGITIGTAALIVVLSVFNGFESLILSMFNSFNPDIKISAVKGKTMSLSNIPKEKLQKLDGVLYYNEVIEESILVQYKKKQHIGMIKGVSKDFFPMSGLDKKLLKGEAVLKNNGLNFALVGSGMAHYIDLRNIDISNALSIHAPNRKEGYQLSLDNSFNQRKILASGKFSVQQELDEKYIITSLDFAKDLLDYKDEITYIELGLTKDANVKVIQKRIQKILGNDYKVKNRFEQQELLYKILKSEKWAIFLILSFIVIIATFNVIGSLSMLILDKKKDIKVLESMGANQQLIKRIFLIEGSLISISGAIFGLILGSLICWVQMQFGLIQLGQNTGSFIVNAYPVNIKITDIILVFLTVSTIGIAAAWIPARQITKRYLNVKLG